MSSMQSASLNPLTLYQTTNLWNGQIENTCRQQSELTEKLKFDLERVENIMGKGENAGYQHFLRFP